MGKRKQDNPQRDYATKRVKRGMGYGKSNLTKAVQKVLRRTTELKEVSKYYSAIHPTATTGYVAYINDAIATGGDMTDRIGRHITSVQIQVDYQVYVTGQTLDTGLVALVYDKQPNGGTPTFSDVFGDAGSTPSGQAFKNTINNGDRFKIVKINQYAVSSSGPVVDKQRMYYKVPESLQDTEYLDQTASPPGTGMWMLCIGSSNNSGTITSLDFAIKYQFTDK